MKKNLKALLIALLIVPCVMLFAACGKTTQYTITPPAEVGFTYARVDGTGNKVDKGKDFKFKITVLDSYVGTPVVKASGTTLTANNDGVYTIKNVTADKTITVTGITEKTPRNGVYNIVAFWENEQNRTETYIKRFAIYIVIDMYENCCTLAELGEIFGETEGFDFDSYITEEDFFVDFEEYLESIYSADAPGEFVSSMAKLLFSESELVAYAEERFEGEYDFFDFEAADDIWAEFTSTMNEICLLSNMALGPFYINITGNDTMNLSMAEYDEELGDWVAVVKTSKFTLEEDTFVFEIPDFYTVYEGFEEIDDDVLIFQYINNQIVISAIVQDDDENDMHYKVVYDFTANKTIPDAIEKVVQYTITPPVEDGFVYARVDGTGNKIDKGEDFKFTITVLDTHEGAPAVKASGTTLTADNDGVYTITNVTADKTITVSGLTEISTIVENGTYKIVSVTLNGEEMVNEVITEYMRENAISGVLEMYEEYETSDLGDLKDKFGDIAYFDFDNYDTIKDFIDDLEDYLYSFSADSIGEFMALIMREVVFGDPDLATLESMFGAEYDFTEFNTEDDFWTAYATSMDDMYSEMMDDMFVVEITSNDTMTVIGQDEDGDPVTMTSKFTLNGGIIELENPENLNFEDGEILKYKNNQIIIIIEYETDTVIATYVKI